MAGSRVQATGGAGGIRFPLALYADKDDNSYGVVRLLAALCVVYTHSFGVVGGWSTPEPLVASTGMSLGAHAVHVFFALSGFMVAASFERSSGVTDFVLARTLRVMPALIVVNLLIVVAGGLILTNAAAADYWTIDNAGRFFARTVLSFSVGVPLLGVFADNPVPGAINIPIWTIRFEVLAYASLLLLLTAMALMRLRGMARLWPVIAILAVSAGWLGGAPDAESFSFAEQLARFFLAFYLGVAAWIARDRVPVGLPILLATAAGATLALATASALSYPLMILAVAYGSFWLGSFRMGALQRWTARTDLSYGVYIIGFFVQQWLAWALPGLNSYGNAGLAMLIAAGAAWLSWTFVERPALNRRRRLIAAGQVASRPTALPAE